MFVYLPVEYHQSLHSFPTRRSSDLAEALTRSNELTRGKKATLFCGLFLTQLSATAVVLLVSYLGGLVHGFFGFRSEEHTSELQSHSDLVCRLLLEKKKTVYHMM